MCRVLACKVLIVRDLLFFLDYRSTTEVGLQNYILVFLVVPTMEELGKENNDIYLLYP